MADDTNKRGPAGRSRIDINQEHGVRYWTKALRGCTATQLREAVRAVGPMMNNVRRILASRAAEV